MIEICNKEDCIGCGACVDICPRGCIRLIADNEGFKYPVSNVEVCIECGACNRACPVLNETKTSMNNHKVFGGYNNDENIVDMSSSGGIFSLLLGDFFAVNPEGLAYGAVLDEDLCVRHEVIHSYSEAYKLRGSKYIQSNLQGIYFEIREFLKLGKKIYFSGTPCQVAGLKQYLNQDYGNLFTQAILCHGVSSPLVWEKYLGLIEQKKGVKVSKVNFRDKTYGWEKYSMAINFCDGSSIIEESKNNLFLKAFGANISLRPSCYSCQFKFPNYTADVTLGDFWNVKTICSALYNSSGVSLIFVSSEKGEKAFERIKKGLTFEKITVEKAIKSQNGIVKNVERNNKRNALFERIDSDNIRNLIEQLTKIPVHKKVRTALGKIYRAIIYAMNKSKLKKENRSGEGRNYYNTRL